MLLANEKKNADFIEIGSVVAFWVEEEITNSNEWIRPFCVGTESQTEARYPIGKTWYPIENATENRMFYLQKSCRPHFW